ncbi:Mo-dependent nitrogenase C-terminal domain-containing protein [Altericista sp. CCNU0014]|uniref:Mo-dependent nitrogenase C-terminal domain-containing protein n=1 Tax=Altericista sp. CCNU0014 TaxID=3082949 RepID=UPI00384F0F7C
MQRLDRGQTNASLLDSIRQRLESIEIQNPNIARFLCKIIPAYCPFARDIKILGHTVLHIPPLCKLNPLYEQIVGLRFKSLSYLVDRCGEDITVYC